MVPTLQDVVLRHLVEHLDEVLDAAGEHLVYVLSARHRAVLFAGAKRKALLGRAVECLVDTNDWSYLDLASTGSELVRVENFAQSVFGSLTRLRAINLAGCVLEGDVFPLLARHCRDLEHLELRDLDKYVSQERYRLHLNQLKAVLPRLEDQGDSSIDSWEDHLSSFEDEEGKLAQLSELVWPDCPKEVEEWVKTHCARTRLLRESRKPTTFQVIHGEVDLSPKDLEDLLDSMGVESLRGEVFSTRRSWNKTGEKMMPWEARAEPGDHPPGLEAAAARLSLKDQIPIAERFRYAYILRRERVLKEYAKEKKRRKRKEVRESGARGATNTLNQWLDEEV